MRSQRMSLVATGVALLILACGSDNQLSTTSHGTVGVVVSTTGYDRDSTGYSLSFDNALFRVVPSDTIIYRTMLPVGTHSLQVGDIASNCLFAGPNPESFTIVSGDTAIVPVAVDCLLDAAPPTLHMDIGDAFLGARDTNRIPLSVLPDVRDSVISATLEMLGPLNDTFPLPFTGGGLQATTILIPIPIVPLTGTASLVYRVRTRAGMFTMANTFAIGDTTLPWISPIAATPTTVAAGQGFSLRLDAYDHSGIQALRVSYRGRITADSSLTTQVPPLSVGWDLGPLMPLDAVTGDSIVIWAVGTDIYGNVDSGRVIWMVAP